MACITKRRGRYVLDFYDNLGQRQRLTLKTGTTLKKAKDKLREIENQKYKMLFKLAIMSGARQGELLGLKWTDILWTTGQIHIQRTYNCGAW